MSFLCITLNEPQVQLIYGILRKEFDCTNNTYDMEMIYEFVKKLPVGGEKIKEMKEDLEFEKQN